MGDEDMDKCYFQNKVNEIAEKESKLFALESDSKVTDKIIESIEDYYEVKLPKAYKNFIKQYGGGYFGFVIVYSCDINGMFYIKDNVVKEWVLEKEFLPVVDFETGDFIGFQVKEGVCQSTATMYLHEENELHEMDIDFYEALLKYGLKFRE